METAQFDELNSKLDRVIDAMATKDDIQRLDGRIEKLESSVNELTQSIERLVKLITDLQTEYAAIKMQMDRYDRWFKEIADKVGIQLKP